ncbi:MAG: S41 family peptidase [Elusimicrobiota bacterium]|jgi:carboxyl-terminal processing protease|nr:S41 family peptidase [Elusimicrobiota bacterium]
MKKKVNVYVILMVAAFFIGSLFPFAYSGVDSGLEQLKVMVDVMDKIQDSYVEETTAKQLVDGALEGMVGSLDEFSEYISGDSMKRMQEETKGEFGGIGLRLTTSREGVLSVVSPMLNSPSYKAGVEPGDIILDVDGKKVADIGTEKAVAALRGQVGSKVKFTVERKDPKTGKTIKKTFNLKRSRIIPEVVFSKMLDKEIGYIFVADFSGHTMETFNKAMQDLTKKGMKALVLDLRFNPGGLLDASVDMVKLFIGENKLIVYTKGRKEEYFKEYKSNAKAQYPDIPIVLLVNEGSASGSEIVAGALQDYGRAVLIGNRTFGKGSVQQVIMLPGDNGLRITVAKYYTPLGRMIHRNFKEKTNHGGIVPDMVIPFDLSTARRITYNTTNLVYSPSKKTAEPESKEKTQDIQLDRALEVLKARNVLANLKPQAATQAAAQTANNTTDTKATKTNKAKGGK